MRKENNSHDYPPLSYKFSRIWPYSPLHPLIIIIRASHLICDVCLCLAGLGKAHNLFFCMSWSFMDHGGWRRLFKFFLKNQFKQPVAFWIFNFCSLSQTMLWELKVLLETNKFWMFSRHTHQKNHSKTVF